MLFVLNSLAVGGTETKIVRIANALVRSGVRVELVYLNGPNTLLDKVDPSIQVTNLHRRGKYSVGALRRLCAIVKREQHVVVAVNQYPLLYVIPAVKWWDSRNIRAVGLINAPIGKETLFEKVYAAFLKRCDRAVFGYGDHREYWVKEYRLCPARTQVIYNGVDCSFYSPAAAASESELLRRELGVSDDAKIIGTVGRFRPEKTFDHLITAVANLNCSGRKTYGLLVGQGGELDRLRDAAISEGVADKIKFLGEQLDVRAALSAMDIFVLPSSLETFSNAALEAMAMARPVVLSAVGGAAEMIDDGTSGMLFPPGNIDALTEILTTLYDSPEIRNAMGAAARERAVRQFGYSALINQYKEFIP